MMPVNRYHDLYERLGAVADSDPLPNGVQDLLIDARSLIDHLSAIHEPYFMPGTRGRTNDLTHCRTCSRGGEWPCPTAELIGRVDLDPFCVVDVAPLSTCPHGNPA